MKGAAFLADIGSTFTKGLVVSLDTFERVCSGQAATSPENGVEKGFENLRAELLARSGFDSFGLCLASSSARGGLRVAALGLMPDFTVKAAGAACLNAGARLLFCHAHRLCGADLERMEKSSPDVIFLAGGTDGGEKECVLHNARVLAGAGAGADRVILFAGNREAADEVRGLLAGREVFVAENVLPELDVLNIGPAREKLREIFLARIASAKGLDGVAGQVDAPITPTPSAVFDAVALLYERAGPRFGEGGLIAVDAGGATTDVYSAAAGSPSGGRVVLRGIPEPLLKRTVEGDIGLRSSLSGLMDEIKMRGSPVVPRGAREWADKAAGDPACLPRESDELRCDALLAGWAVKIALERHCGRLEEHYSPGGRVFVQKGKDLRGAGVVFATGGVFAGNRFAVPALESALKEGWEEDILAPASPRVVPDRHYVLYAAGLLSSVDRDAAYAVMEENLLKNEA